MKNIYEVLRQKELELHNLQAKFQHVQQDIETLKLAARLLADDNDSQILPMTRGTSMAAVAADR